MPTFSLGDYGDETSVSIPLSLPLSPLDEKVTARSNIRVAACDKTV
jgi:hypothetical protein